MTNWVPDLDLFPGPRYKAIADALAAAISNGELAPDQRMPTHRALADALSVTTGTVTRAYSEAERRGLVYGVVGRGTFVGNPSTRAEEWQFLESPKEGLIELNLNLPLRANRADLLAEAMASLAANPRDINLLLDYQPDVGVRAHREVISTWLARDGWQPSPEQLVITNGGQHGLLVTLMSLTRPGDNVLVEALTYPGFTAIARQLGLQTQGLAMDDEGITPKALESACKQGTPRVLFCTPTLQNPTTATMSLERRKILLEICKKNGITIIEDDVSAGLAVETPPPLAALAPDQVHHVGSFSKTVAAGIRVGYIVLPAPMQERVGAAIKASCWMASPLMVAVACEWIRSGNAKRFLDQHREEISARRELVLDSLSEYDIRGGTGGLHLWLMLPDPWRASEFTDAAASKGVLVMGSASFSVGRENPPHAVRISVGAAHSRDQLSQGLSVLRNLLQDGPEPLLEAL